MGDPKDKVPREPQIVPLGNPRDFSDNPSVQGLRLTADGYAAERGAADGPEGEGASFSRPTKRRTVGGLVNIQDAAEARGRSIEANKALAAAEAAEARGPSPHPDNRTGMQQTSASQARSAVPLPSASAAPKALTPEQLLAMAKEMEARTAAQHTMVDSSQRDSAGGIMPAWLVNDAKKGGYGG